MIKISVLSVDFVMDTTVSTLSFTVNCISKKKKKKKIDYTEMSNNQPEMDPFLYRYFTEVVCTALTLTNCSAVYRKVCSAKGSHSWIASL